MRKCYTRDTMRELKHVYEVRGVNLISDVLPFGRLWYGEPNAVSNVIEYAMHYNRSHDAVIRAYGDAGNVIMTATSERIVSRETATES